MNEEPVRLQACVFRRTKAGKDEPGIARVRFGFDTHDIDWIIDNNGEKVKRTWDYRLLHGPLRYLESPQFESRKVSHA